MASKAVRVHAGWLTLILVIAALISAVISLAFGSEKIPLAQVVEIVHTRLMGGSLNTPQDAIVWQLRLPRAALALVAGAGLSIAGAGMQTLVKNPLADPYLLGLSAGASVGATAVITMGTFAIFGIWALSIGALIGALGAAMTVYFIARAQGGLTPLRLVLSGVVISAAFNSIASFMVFLSDDSRAANSVMFWLLGSIAGARWEKVIIPAVVVGVVAIVMICFSSWLDALAAGPATATALGVPVGLMRTGLFICVGLAVGTLVAVSGGIGFVGLIIPHVTRMVVGSLHVRVIPVCAALGALFMIWVDVLSRIIARPQEIPLGVVTGVIGAPLFIILMGRRSYTFSGRDA